MATDTASKEATKDRVTEEIFRARDDIYALGDEIYRDPELGFKEHRTAGRHRVARRAERSRDDQAVA